MTYWKLVIHKIGKRSRLVRRLYYKLTNGMWLWGIVGYVRDYGIFPYEPPHPQYFDEIIEKIFTLPTISITNPSDKSSDVKTEVMTELSDGWYKYELKETKDE